MRRILLLAVLMTGCNGATTKPQTIGPRFGVPTGATDVVYVDRDFSEWTYKGRRYLSFCCGNAYGLTEVTK